MKSKKGGETVGSEVGSFVRWSWMVDSYVLV